MLKQNDPTAMEIMRHNREKYGVSHASQMRHALKAFWIVPIIYGLSKLGGILPQHPGSLLIMVGALVFVMYHFVKDMERTDPVEKAKQPKLLPGVKYHVEKGRIVDEDGHVVA